MVATLNSLRPPTPNCPINDLIIFQRGIRGKSVPNNEALAMIINANHRLTLLGIVMSVDVI